MDEKLSLKEKLKLLEEYIDDLKEQKNASLQELKRNKLLRRYLTRTLQMAFEACLDLGIQLVCELELREAEDGKELMAVLCEAGYLPEMRLVSFQRMAKFRDVLANQYTEIDPELLYNTLPRSIGDLQLFFDRIRGAFPGQP